jgi:hypothetical protein
MNILTRFSEQLLTFEFARVNTEVFFRVGLVLESVALAINHRCSEKRVKMLISVCPILHFFCYSCFAITVRSIRVPFVTC